MCLVRGGLSGQHCRRGFSAVPSGTAARLLQHSAMSGEVRGRLGELDALRGLAALAVVLFHFTTRYDAVTGHVDPMLMSVPWGHFGVQFFFGISGFVIFMTLERTRRPMDFIVSRFSRLFPAYWAAIAVTTAVVWAGPLTELRVPPVTVMINLTMLQGLFGVRSIDGAYWTLLVELSFYAMMFGLYRMKALSRIEWVLVGWIGLKWLWWLVPGLPYRVGVVLVQEFIPFFALGICAYRYHAGERTFAAVAPVATFALATVLVIDGASHFAISVMVTAAFGAFATGRAGWLAWPPLVWLGGVSYTLYLLHENIGWTVINALETRGVNSNVAALLAVVFVLGLAAAVTQAIERPAMAWIRGRWKHRATGPN